MRRGRLTYPVYCKTNGKNTNIDESQAMDQVELLKSWAPNIRLKIFNLKDGPVDGFNKVLLNGKEFLNFINRIRAKGICLSIDLKNYSEEYKKIDFELPIFYPLIGLDEEWILELSDMIRDIDS